MLLYHQRKFQEEREYRRTLSQDQVKPKGYAEQVPLCRALFYTELTS